MTLFPHTAPAVIPDKKISLRKIGNSIGQRASDNLSINKLSRPEVIITINNWMKKNSLHLHKARRIHATYGLHDYPYS